MARFFRAHDKNERNLTFNVYNYVSAQQLRCCGRNIQGGCLDGNTARCCGNWHHHLAGDQEIREILNGVPG